VVLYIVSDPTEFAYLDRFTVARQYGVRLVPIVTKAGFTSPRVISTQLSSELIRQVVPDYSERLFYISGPNMMVDATKEYLRELGVGHTSIKTDHFSGY